MAANHQTTPWVLPLPDGVTEAHCEVTRGTLWLSAMCRMEGICQVGIFNWRVMQAGFLLFPLGWFLLVLVAVTASWYMWQHELPAFWWCRVTEWLELERTTSETSSTNPLP